MSATLPDKWYYRITYNQQTGIEQVVGPCEGRSFRDVIKELEAAGKSELAAAVHTAAVKAGCTGEAPLVDDRLVEKLRQERFGNRPAFSGPTHGNGFYKGPPRAFTPPPHAAEEREEGRGPHTNGRPAPRGRIANHNPHLEMELPLEG